jgi:hypothetical protein
MREKVRLDFISSVYRNTVNSYIPPTIALTKTLLIVVPFEVDAEHVQPRSFQ